MSCNFCASRISVCHYSSPITAEEGRALVSASPATFCIQTLGCPKNEADSDRLERVLSAAGYAVAPAALADLVIVNTCGFIDAAKVESLDAVFAAAAAAHGRGAQVAAVGCLVERYRDELARELPEADLLCGFETAPLTRRLAEMSANRGSAAERAAETSRPVGARAPGRPKAPAVRAVGATRRARTRLPLHAYLKISDGCDRHCAYCAIPLIKGAYETMSPQRVLSDARAALARGAREIVLVGQDTSRWRWPGYGGLPRLLADLAALEPAWLRLLYLQPDGIDAQLLEALAAYAVPYVDVPLQHASGRILRAMNRSGDGATHLELLRRVRATLPGAAIRSTFIAGFPGETEADLEELLAFIAEARLAVGGVFAYDPQEGTAAAALAQQVPAEEREQRAARIAVALDEGARRYWEALVGEQVAVLIERGRRSDASEATGRIAAQAPDVDGFTLVRGAPLRRGSVVKARVEAVAGYDVMTVVE
jgi:ribosomal protein S12 methylthiotransferase